MTPVIELTFALGCCYLRTLAYPCLLLGAVFAEARNEGEDFLFCGLKKVGWLTWFSLSVLSQLVPRGQHKQEKSNKKQKGLISCNSHLKIALQSTIIFVFLCLSSASYFITNLNIHVYCRCLNLYLHKLSKLKFITCDSVLTETEYTCLNCRWLYSESHSIPLMSFLLTRYIQFVIPFETLPKTGYILFNFQQIVLVHPIQLSVLLKLMNVATHQAPHDVL